MVLKARERTILGKIPKKVITPKKIESVFVDPIIAGLRGTGVKAEQIKKRIMGDSFGYASRAKSITQVLDKKDSGMIHIVFSLGKTEIPEAELKQRAKRIQMEIEKRMASLGITKEKAYPEIHYSYGVLGRPLLELFVFKNRG